MIFRNLFISLSVMSVVGDGVSEIFRIAPHHLGFDPAITVDSQYAAIPRDYLLGAVPGEIEHMIHRLFEEQCALPVIPQLEPVPEELPGAIPIPIAADKVRVSGQRVPRPLEQQVPLVIE